MSKTIIFILCLALAGSLSADFTDAAAQAREWREAHEPEIIDRFSTLLSIPNVASDTENIRRNAEHISALLESAGMQARLLELDGGNPAVYAERMTPGATRTIMIYVHYDGQPVNPANWASDPWTPVIRTDMVENNGQLVAARDVFDPEWRIFARSAGDDKAPIIALHSALYALRAAGIEPSVNIKVFMDGEEEAGSPNLRAMLEKHQHLLTSDLWLFCDGPVHQSRRWQMVYGVRGSYGFNLTTYGPNRPLHSGHYGNWAPNPIMLLTNLISSMRDVDGQVLIKGFYDQVRPLDQSEQQAIASSPDTRSQLAREMGFAAPETSDRIEMAVSRPALNLRGISGGNVGDKARNAISPSAQASLGLRLVPDMTPENLRSIIEQHIRDQGFYITPDAPSSEERLAHPKIARVEWSNSGGYPAYRADFNDPVAIEVRQILGRLSDNTLVQTPTMGGSLPIYIIDDVLDTPVVLLPVANHDNNQHGANENLRLQNLWDAIEIYAAVLTGL